MKTEFERSLHNNYMIIKNTDGISSKDEMFENYQEDYQMKMLSAAGAKGFLLLKLRYFNGIAEFCYDISSKQKLADWFKGKKISYQILVNILESLCEALENAEDYLLDVNHIMLNPNYIFIDTDKYAVYLCYCPFYEEDVLRSGQEFLQYLLEILDYNDKIAVETGYEVFRICMKDGFRTDIIKNCFVEIDKDDSFEKGQEWNRVVEVNVMNEEVEEEQELPIIPYFKPHIRRNICIVAITLEILFCLLFLYYRVSLTGIIIHAILSIILVGVVLVFGIFYKKIERLTRLINVKGYISYSDKVDDYAYEETCNNKSEDKETEQEETVLLAYEGRGERLKRLHYIGTRQQEDIILTKYPFTVGKAESGNDYCLAYPFVSRTHFRIEKIDDIYYITDTNSRNGLLLNGESLNATETKELKSGDRIELGDLVFLFQ